MPILTTLGAACAKAWGFTSGLVKDQYFNLVSLLLPGNGTNGAQNNTFLDSSTNNFTITRNGNTTQGTFSPFSQTGWGNYFGGSSWLATSSSPATLSGNFTFECWVYITSYATSRVMATLGDGSFATGVEFFVTTSGRLSMFGNTAFLITGTTQSVPLNTWTHVAFVRSSNTIKLYVNGAEDATTASNSTAFTGIAQIGRELYTGASGNFFLGYISNLRINTTAVYTGAFTPSTTPLTAISGTALLTCQSNRFIDNSSSPLTITANNSPSVVAFSPFAPTAAYTTAAVGGSGYFDGTGDYLTAPYSTALQLTGDFTIEVWVNLVSKITNFPCIVNNYNVYGANGGFAIFANHNSGTANKYNVALNGSFPVINSTDSITYNAWQHIALVRSGSGSNNITLYVNGVANGTTTSTVTITGTSNNWWIGASGDDLANSYINGYMSNFRVLKGTALYTGNFTPPTAPLTAITNTQLLLNYTNAGITDATAKNDLETVGNAQISTTQSKWGGSSISFDGTGDYLYSISKPTTSLEGDFTIELWLYRNVSGNTPIFTLGDCFTANGFEIYIGSSGTQLIVFSGNASRITSATLPSVTTWAYLAATRSGSTVTLYLNGTSLGTWSSSSTFSGAVYVGTEFYNGSVSGSLNGYIQDLRITKGYARTITASPTAPFPVQ